MVQRAQGGDRRAFGDLFRRYQDIAFRAAFLVTTDAAEAEDALQEGFIKAFQALDRFDLDRPFRPWILRIVTNEARNRRRSAGRLERLQLQLIDSTTTQESSPESTVLAAEDRSRVLRGLAELTEADRLVLIFYYFLDIGPSELAQLFDRSPSAMRSRLHRARERLRFCLSQADAESESPLSEEGLRQ